MKYGDMIAAAWIAFWIGRAVSSVGEMPKPSTEPYGWGLVILLALLMLVPYVAGRFSANGSGSGE